ncbi:Alpha/Beta hydrolase protein [Pilaira anomala]|nr:Alpha/Beta hydrolase protein [Pilaira anomala]
MFTFIPSKHDAKKIQIFLECKVNTKEAPVIIIAHPYGPLGGSMNNNVVSAVQRHFVSKGYLTCCMNFRGSGLSEGRTSWTGIAEKEDYESVLDYLINQEDINYPKPNKVILCGYSYGAMIANSVECKRLPCAYLLISIPLGVIWALATLKQHVFKRAQTTQMTLCIYGDHDQFTGTGRFSNWCQGHDNISNQCIEGADHFWFDYESQLVQHIEDWRRRRLNSF